MDSSSKKHLLYLDTAGFISHSGELSIGERTKKEGESGLYSGEIIGFSPDRDTLFTAWLNSTTHRESILNPSWSKIGVSFLEKDSNYICVVNFSSGIVYNIVIDRDEKKLSCRFIEKPTFYSGGKELNYTISDSMIEVDLINRESKIIRVYNAEKELTDIVEVFF